MKWDREMRREREKHAGDDSVDFIKRFFGCFPVYNCSSQGKPIELFFLTEPTQPCLNGLAEKFGEPTSIPPL
jgi:hypothetical protein